MILTVLSPEKEILHVEDAVSVELPGTLGRFVVCQDHAPLISPLEKGTIDYRTRSGSGSVPIDDGFVRIEENTITVCAG